MSSQGYREKCLDERVSACYVCASDDGLVVHHIDHDRTNNELENLIPLCYSCHRKVHSGNNHGGEIGSLQKQLGGAKGKSSVCVTDEQKSTLVELRAALEAKELRDISQGEAVRRASELALAHIKNCGGG